MKNRSIIFWVILSIALVGSLPFLLSWYQINSSNKAIIDQAQKSHMIIARATADRIGSVIKRTAQQLDSLGKNQDIYLEPDSSKSSETLKSTLLSQKDIQSLGLFLKTNKESFKIIHLLKRKNLDSEELNQLLKKHSSTSIELIELNNKKYLLMNKPTARPNVFISIMIETDFASYLDPRILGQSANLFMLNSDGTVIEGTTPEMLELTESFLNQLKTNQIISSANRTKEQNSKTIEALANIPFSEWYIVSQQPTKFAEKTTSEMSNTAKKSFALAILIMTLLVFLAYYSWIKPIRKIIKSQKKLLGIDSDDYSWNGDEVTALEQSFESIARHINDRNSLSNIFVDRYQVISPIGKGGMSSVFLGMDPRLNRHVALKTLPIDPDHSFGTREDMSQFLVQEAITAAKLSHRNIVSIYDVVSTKNTAFIAMEFIDGENLGAVLERHKTLPISLILPIIIAISRGLHSAHESGFIHRDIKPENILLGKNGDIKLTDFGTTILYRSLETDHITGTSGYIAPEIYLKGEHSVRSDLFSLGLTIATCLLGKNPFIAKKQHITKANTINKEVVFSDEIKSQGSKEIFQLIGSLINKDPNKRPASASIVADLIIESAQNKVQWNAETMGIQSAQETIYENSENTTLHFNNH